MIQVASSGTPLYRRRRGLQVTSSGGAAFSPASIAGLTAWFKADAGTSTTTNNVAMSQWNDQSVNASNATQATGVSQPLYQTAILNGLPGVLFDGSNDFMDAAGVVIAAQPTTTFVVVKANVVTASHNALDGITVRQAVTQAPVSANWGLNAGSDVGGSVASDTNAHQLTALFSGASTQLWVDRTASNPGTAGTNGLNGLRIGSFNGAAAGGWSGHVFEILVYSGDKTANRTAIEGYLQAKWATP